METGFREKVGAKWQTLSPLAQAYVIAGLVLLIPMIISCLGAILHGENWSAFFLNFGTELGGAFVTFVIIDRFVGNRERLESQKEEEQRLKETLITQLHSRKNNVTVLAANLLRQHGWLTDGSLQGVHLAQVNLKRANLRLANLQGANLRGAKLQRALLANANLQGAHLTLANLQGANLRGANLQGAHLLAAKLQGVHLGHANLQETLANANLQKANLEGANLQGAHLEGANLQETNLLAAKLQEANLWGANLQEAHLERAEFDENTLLPDGSKWTPNTDMGRFTDPEHPEFWSPDGNEAEEEEQNGENGRTSATNHRPSTYRSISGAALRGDDLRHAPRGKARKSRR